MTDFKTRSAELPTLGVHSVTPICLARLNQAAFGKLNSFSLQNKGKGNVSFELKKRGQRYTIAAEDISALQVGATDRFRGPFAKRRVDPKSIVIVDVNAVVPQRVEDTNGDGILWQTDGPTTVTYPKQVGTINYNDGIVDFTFELAVTTPVTVDYKHTDWTSFGTAITITSLVAGGGSRDIIILPDRADNFYDGVRDEEEIGFFAALIAGQVPTILGLVVTYMGDDSEIILPPHKGEIDDYPFHNA
jgi:hypothetical protein